MSRIKHSDQKVVGILGCGEIGKPIAQICKDAGFTVFVRELEYDELKDKRIDYLHVNIPEKVQGSFIKIVVKTIKEFKPKLTIINSSVTPKTTRKIFQKTKLPIAHSPVIGRHSNLYNSIKYHFKKIIGPVDSVSLKYTKKHFKDLGIAYAVFKDAEASETAKLLDLTYYGWNIIFCKWVSEVCTSLNVDFDEVYTKYNKIYNEGYEKILPQVVRPILVPTKGVIGGHCTIEDTILLHKYFKNRFSEFILKENKSYLKEKPE